MSRRTYDVAKFSAFTLEVLSDKATGVCAQTVAHYGKVVWRQIVIDPNQLADVPGDDGAHHHCVCHRLWVQRHLRSIVPVDGDYIMPAVSPLFVPLVVENEVF